MLTFDAKGYLTPNTALPSTIKEIENTFVIEYSSVERSKLFESYKSFLADLKTLCGGIEIKHWINGSFVTKCKPRPSDIDMVVFLNRDLLKGLGTKIKRFTYPYSKENYPGVDAYVIRVSKEGERDQQLYELDRAYWHDQFDTTRRNRKGLKAKKGFVEIVY